MSQHNTAPGDGPLMQWISVHAHRLLLNLNDKQSFNDVLAGYRYARDSQKIHQMDSLPFKIEGLAGNIEFAGKPGKYIARLTLSEVRINESRLDRDDVTTNTLAIATEQAIPESFFAGAVGCKADKIIDLPKALKGIIAGRDIVDIETRETSRYFYIDPHPWAVRQRTQA